MFNETIIKILFLFLPGIIAVSIMQYFKNKNRKYTVNETFLYSFIIGVISYVIYSIFEKEVITKLINYNTNNFPLVTKDIFYLCSIGILLGVMFTYLRTHGVINKIFSYFKISYEDGYETVLETIHKYDFGELEKVREKFVQIKLLDGTADYFGFIKHYEIHNEYTEFLLFGNDSIKKEPVEIIFKNNLGPSKEYKQDAVYLLLKNGSFVIEFL